MQKGNEKNWTVGQLMDMVKKYGIKVKRNMTYAQLQELVEKAMAMQS